jgi:hypothetical protein
MPLVAGVAFPEDFLVVFAALRGEDFPAGRRRG